MPESVLRLLLARDGLVFIHADAIPAPRAQVTAIELEFAAIGHVASSRLEQQLLSCSSETLADLRVLALDALLTRRGGGVYHEPLFRRFPAGIPQDTAALWRQKVLVHFLQSAGQSCLTCRRKGTTHVLQPCEHVVCDQCFDGATYSACPVCEHHVDRSSPFFRETEARKAGKESVRFELLDLGDDPREAARKLFTSLCARRQALSPNDRDALQLLVRDLGKTVLEWLPESIPLRESVAMIFGTLLGAGEPELVLPHARRFIGTATDVLRLIAVMSGADGSLQGETRIQRVEVNDWKAVRFWGRIADQLAVNARGVLRRSISVSMKVRRFKMVRLPRPLRRTLLALLEGMPKDRLVEDMRRHRSYWVGVGELLHPHEYARRFPAVARAFQIVRGRAPDGTPAPAFETWAGRAERLIEARDVPELVAHLADRPGELGRRLDQILRLAPGDPAAIELVLEAFEARVGALATPMLLTLRSHYATRGAPLPVRVYWPKGKVAQGASTADHRAPLLAPVCERVVDVVTAELLRRFSAASPFAAAILDERLGSVPVPFNERTQARASIDLPRGARVPLAAPNPVAPPDGTWVRLFLHWCEPELDGQSTDLDLSVAIYDAGWSYLGVCSYYALELEMKKVGVVARSSGDLRDAPWPGGATEFVDLDLAAARRAGARFAVMVVNAYGGMPFDLLERAFAGIMLRDDPTGLHFDPRTVETRFSLTGAHGVYLPLVIDLEARELVWLDVCSKGQLEMNNVETSRAAITKLCPELMAYFASGVRPSLLELGMLHAAARCGRVTVRGDRTRTYVRRAGEAPGELLARLMSGEADEIDAHIPVSPDAPVLALLHRGDLALPEGSSVYALFRERVVPTVRAADLLA